MEKYIYDENNGLWYELQGDYYIPCLVLPDVYKRQDMHGEIEQLLPAQAVAVLIEHEGRHLLRAEVGLSLIHI